MDLLSILNINVNNILEFIYFFFFGGIWIRLILLYGYFLDFFKFFIEMIVNWDFFLFFLFENNLNDFLYFIF